MRNPSAFPVNTFVGRLSMTRARTPQRAIQYEAMSPAGPAPTMSLGVQVSIGAL